MLVRKRPVVVEAVQMTQECWKAPENWPEWLKEAQFKPVGEMGSLNLEGKDIRLQSCWISSSGDLLYLQTLEGKAYVPWNNWIIRGVMGELYSCDPEIFEMTYERIE